MERANKKEKGLIDMASSVVISGVRRWVEVEDVIRGINGDGKNTIRNVLLMKHK